MDVRFSLALATGVACVIFTTTAPAQEQGPLLVPAPVAEKTSCEAVADTPETSEQLFKRIEAVQPLILKLSDGHQIFTEYLPARDSDKPTFVLLPGVNRGWRKSDPAFLALATLGDGVAAMNFSTQPLSVNTLPDGTVPAFRNQKFNLADFAFEANSFIAYLRSQGVKNIVPVTLSFSGILSPFLDVEHHPLIVDTVPMTSQAATNPDGAAKVRQLQQMAALNPFFGKAIADTMLQNTYFTTWGPQVKSSIQNYNLNPARQEDMTHGYTAMSVATQGQEWDLKNLPAAPERRAFVLAEKEAPALFFHQLETAAAYMKTHPHTIIAIVGESGHVIPSDQPALFGNLLHALASPELKEGSGLVVIGPHQKLEVPPEEVDAFIRELKARGGKLAAAKAG